MAELKVTHMGLAGVNVDKNPLEMGDDELQQAQNAITDVDAGFSTLRKRPGLVAFNTDIITEGSVLGGSDLPLRNTSNTGLRNLFIGRGPTA
jgi:hypothetical protein